ncbi:uncharacterized protein LOC130988884 [Salvia miltiorrhiza]|uniref:uncharacterized protein LOC130988846 n=1 Tax=Salvia miltiorrhiza TaxID=226208 RepID=UPI0025AD5FFD|nr:uncharacterized protein LOC130988846 [Salvia miltiorrhiza]XP_057768834.1 uncharacterized protein LOC130988884 [Salvia miltiorrhiza]
MKASIKFREEQRPLLRAKIPINILNYPFQSGVVAGESKELSLNLSTYFESGPSLKFAYRPNDSESPFSFIFKTGIGHYGSPIRSPLTMSAEFNVIGCENPSFFIRFKPDLGDFSVKKLISSAIVRKLGGKSNPGAADEGNFVKNVASLFPAVESKAAAGWLVNGIVRGTDLTATTALPLRDCAMINFRWGLRVPRSGDYDALGVQRRTDRAGGYRLPQLVMDKIGIEHVAKADSKPGPTEEYGKLAGACLEVKKQLEVIQAENGSLNKALTDFRSDLAAGKMEIVPQDHRNMKDSGAGGEPNEGLKAA